MKYFEPTLVTQPPQFINRALSCDVMVTLTTRLYTMNIRVNNDIGNPTVSHVTLHIKFDNVFLPVLHIPKPEIKHYALKPYKWLRFLGFILCGNTQPGFIAVSENEEPIPEETIIGDELEHNSVYYIPSGMLQYL